MSFRSRAALSCIVAASLLFGCQSPGGASRDVEQYDATTFYETIGLRAGSVAPDGQTVLYSSDASGVFNAYAIAPGGGEPVQLTASTTDAITGISFFPADRRLVYQKDVGGNEIVHVYVRELDGKVVDLTPGEKVKA